MRNTDVVSVRGLRKAYGNRVVVDGLDFDAPAGEIAGLIGANGASGDRRVRVRVDEAGQPVPAGQFLGLARPGHHPFDSSAV